MCDSLPPSEQQKHGAFPHCLSQALFTFPWTNKLLEIHLLSSSISSLFWWVANWHYLDFTCEDTGICWFLILLSSLPFMSSNSRKNLPIEMLQQEKGRAIIFRFLPRFLSSNQNYLAQMIFWKKGITKWANSLPFICSLYTGNQCGRGRGFSPIIPLLHYFSTLTPRDTTSTSVLLY